MISATLGSGLELRHTHSHHFVERERHQSHPVVQVVSGFGLACDVH